MPGHRAAFVFPWVALFRAVLRTAFACASQVDFGTPTSVCVAVCIPVAAMGSINAKESAGSFDSESSECVVCPACVLVCGFDSSCAPVVVLFSHGHSCHSAPPDGSSIANAHTETPSTDSRDGRKEDASTGDTADDGTRCRGARGVAVPHCSSRATDSDMVSHVFTWEHGGHNVYLTGTFTGWERHIPMHRSGHDFVTIVKLQRKGYAFKFIVDNDWRFSPEQPVIRDPSGNINNYCDLRHFHHNDTEPIDYERRNSNPDLPYTQTAPDIDDYTLQPPALPLQLRDIILNSVRRASPLTQLTALTVSRVRRSRKRPTRTPSEPRNL